MDNYTYLNLRARPELEQTAAAWFHDKWGVPEQAYLDCMDAYLAGETEYGWYLCLDGDKIVGGVGVIENDFHDRKDLAPNGCAVYTAEKALQASCCIPSSRRCVPRASRRCILSPTTRAFMSATAGSFCAWCRATARTR